MIMMIMMMMMMIMMMMLMMMMIMSFDPTHLLIKYSKFLQQNEWHCWLIQFSRRRKIYVPHEFNPVRIHEALKILYNGSFFHILRIYTYVIH